MTKCLLALILLILFSASVLGMTATLLSPFIQINVDKLPFTEQHSVGVRNDGNETAIIQFIPESDIASMVSMESYNISLAPGEERFVKFNITITEMKKIISRIVLNVSSVDQDQNLTQSQIIYATTIVIMPKNESSTKDVNITIKQPVHVTDPNSNQSSESNSTAEVESTGASFQYIILVIAGILIAALVAVIILKTKAGAKNE
jgi:hypothetical protein